MKKFFYTLSNYLKPAIFLLLIAAVLFFYKINKDYIAAFKMYHLRSYQVSYKIRYNRLIGNSYKVSADSSKQAESIPVIVYHGVVDKPDKNDKYNITPEVFADQMITLKKAGYQTISLEQFAQFNERKIQLPEKSFLLTFDDGRKDSYYPVNPILSALNYKATMFVIGNEINNKGKFFLNKNELLKMKSSRNWEIQPHTYAGHGMIQLDKAGHGGNFYSNKMWLKNEDRIETDSEYLKRVTDDFRMAHLTLKNELQIESFAFAYPFGDYGQDTLNYKNAERIVLAESRKYFPITFRQGRDGNGYSLNYPLSEYPFKRLDGASFISGEALYNKLTASAEKSLPYDSSTRENIQRIEWLRSWGSLSFENKGMLVGSDNTSVGGTVFLDGSKTWKDYQVTTNLKLVKGSDIFLICRYLDDNNYIMLHINDKTVNIEQRIKGVDQILSKTVNRYQNENGIYDLGILVKGLSISGIVNGKSIISAIEIDGRLQSGGVGFKVWDRTVGNAQIKINQIKIEGR